MSFQFTRAYVGGRHKNGSKHSIEEIAAPFPWGANVLILVGVSDFCKSKGSLEEWGNPFLSPPSPSNRVCSLEQEVWEHFLQIPSRSATFLLPLLDQPVICFLCIQPGSSVWWITYFGKSAHTLFNVSFFVEIDPRTERRYQYPWLLLPGGRGRRWHHH